MSNKCICDWTYEECGMHTHATLEVVDMKCPVHGITYGDKKQLV